VLVYQVGKIPRNALRRAKAHLSNVGAHLLGIAMNDVKAEISGYSPYSQYMVKYYGEDAGKTLLQRLSGRWSRKPGAPSGGKRAERRRARRLRRVSDESDLSDLPFSHATYIKTVEAGPTEPYPPAREQPERRGRVTPSRMPLWAWIIIGVLILMLILLWLHVFQLSGRFTESVDRFTESVDESQSEPREDVSQLPPERPSIIPSGAQQAAPSTDGGEQRSITATARGPAERVWSVQVGSYRTIEEAESLLQTLSALENPDLGSAWTRIEEVPGLGRWSRVFVGQYPERTKCERAAQTLRETNRIAMTMVRSIIPPPP